MYDYWWIWCLFLVVGFGGCIGSFLNVVVYRLPRGIHLGDPLWSFCPQCHSRIQWYDNIPVLSYFRLRGACRSCRAPIPPRYVVIEVITILAFVVLFDAFFVAGLLNGIVSDGWSVGYRFYTDWPIYAAHVLLFSGLIAMSTIDMEHYWVDIRFTKLATASAILLHALWTPSRTPAWPRPGPELAAAAVAAMMVAIATHLIAAWLWRRRARAEDSHSPVDEQTSPAANLPTSEPGRPEAPSPAMARRLPPSAWLAGLVLVTCLMLLVSHLAADGPRSGTSPRAPLEEPAGKSVAQRADLDFMIRAIPAVLFSFGALVAGSVVPRQSDQMIEEALEAERHGARRMAGIETAVLLPTVVIFVVVLILVRGGGTLEPAWQAAWRWQIWNQTRPVVGLGTAAAGFIIAGAAGWAVRIFFTLVLGKEAFGTGDIHIMAAAGAAMGWEVVVVGFFLSALLALLGKAVTLPFKRGHALPMGPWITMGLFIALLLREPLVFGRFIEPLRFVYRTWSANSS